MLFKKIPFKFIFIFSFICIILLISLFSLGVFSTSNLRLTDTLYEPKLALPSIVILTIDDQSISEIGRWPWDRKVFADLLPFLNESKIIVFDIGFFEESEDDEIFAEAIKKAGNVLLPVEYIKFEESNGDVIGTKLLKPPKIFENTNKYTGYVNLLTDRDGITRGANLNIKGDYDAMAISIAKALGNDPAIPKEKRYLVNYVGSALSFKNYPISYVLNGKVLAKDLKGKIIFIGATANDLHDDYYVPTSKDVRMSGVEIHAHLLQTLITNKPLNKAPDSFTYLFIILFAVIITLAFKFTRPLYSILLSFSLVIIYYLIALSLFKKGIIINLIYPPLTLVIVTSALVLESYLYVKKSRANIKHSFEKYVSPVVVNHIMENIERLNLGGEKKHITILFSDIRGFTKFSQDLDPQELVKLLNEYLSRLTDLILINQGLIDKYLGDAIMAFWGAPLDCENQEELACKTAIEMIREINKIGKEQKTPLKMGIGINSGDAVVGNMGSHQRFDYTCMGDTINLGSRLEGLTKFYGVNIVVSEIIKKKVEDKFSFRELDKVKVVGRDIPVTIYELITEDFPKFNRSYESALHNYFNKKWDKAIKDFNESLKHKDDLAAKLFIERCKNFKKTPPPKGWDGVFEMKTK